MVEHLVWDQDSARVYTDRPVRVQRKDDVIFGEGLLAAEDMSFFSHRGFDTHELKIVARDAVQGKKLRGASTITQQLAKNLWLSPSRSPLRKVRVFAIPPTWECPAHAFVVRRVRRVEGGPRPCRGRRVGLLH